MKHAKIDKAQKEFLKAMKKKFQEPAPTKGSGLSEASAYLAERTNSHLTLLPYRRY